MLQFEVSKKTAIVTIVATLVIYVSFAVQDFSDPETGDYDNVRSNTEDFVQGAWNHVSSLRVVKYFLLYVSLYGLGNIRVIPLLASITLLVLTYLLTATMAKKRFAGLIAFFALLQSPLFLRFDTTSTYDYGWIAFYLLSLYFALSKKLWYLSPLAFVLSLFSKPLVAVYIPLVMFFIWRADLTRMRRIFLIIPYGLLLTFAVIVASIGSDAIVRIRFDMSLLVAMIYGIPNYLTEDALFWITLLPVCGGLFLLGLKRTYYGQSILLLIGGTLLGYFVLEGFTNISVQQYRFVSLLAASFIGLGMLFSSDRRLEGIPLQRCQKAIPIAILCLTSLPVGLVMSYVLFPSYVTGPINSFAREIATLAGQ